MPLLIKCSSPSAAPHHPHLRAPPHLCCHVCCAHARLCLSTGCALNRRFDLIFGTAAVLAQEGGGGGLLQATSTPMQYAHQHQIAKRGTKHKNKIQICKKHYVC